MNRRFCLTTGVWMLASCASELGDPIEPVIFAAFGGGAGWNPQL